MCLPFSQLVATIEKVAKIEIPRGKFSQLEISSVNRELCNGYEYE